MSADDAREELEAAIWRRVHDSGARPIGLDRKGMSEILDAADRYAAAVAAEKLDRYAEAAADAPLAALLTRRIRGRQRLAEATDETRWTRRAS